MRKLLNIVKPYFMPNFTSILRTKSTYSKSELEAAIKESKEEGKIEGLAYGIYTLFHQDRIKKPTEMVCNTHLLRIKKSDLELVDLITEYEIEEAINILKTLIKGDRAKAFALIITSPEFKSWELDTPPHCLNHITKILSSHDNVQGMSVEDITKLLGDANV